MAREPQPQVQAQMESRPTATPEGAEAVLPSPARRQTKQQLIVDLLERPEGRGLGELMAATGWQAHTSRAALTGLRKKGHVVSSSKKEGEDRIYRIEPIGSAG